MTTPRRLNDGTKPKSGAAHTRRTQIGHTRTETGTILAPYRPAQSGLEPLRLPTVAALTFHGTHTDPGATMSTEGRAWEAHRYTLTISDADGAHRMTSPYSEGTAHEPGEAAFSDAIGSLFSDAGMVLPYLEITHRDAPPWGKYVPAYHGAHKEWGADLGYTDPAEARDAFRACMRTANRLRDMLTPDVFDAALEIAQTW